ncbi:MAG: hemerythrin domain-containing protein, partial [Dermatophilaceae bacterium]
DVKKGSHVVTTSEEGLTTTLTDQHAHIKDLMETVVAREGAERVTAFAELCRFLAAHEAAEEECIHTPAKEELDGDTTVVDQRVEEEDQAGKAISELERLDPDSEAFREGFEQFRRAVIAHAEAEEHEELPRLRGRLDQYEVTRTQEALSRVSDLASRNGDSGTSFMDRLQAARAEFRSSAPTAR